MERQRGSRKGLTERLERGRERAIDRESCVIGGSFGTAKLWASVDYGVLEQRGTRQTAFSSCAEPCGVDSRGPHGLLPKDGVTQRRKVLEGTAAKQGSGRPRRMGIWVPRLLTGHPFSLFRLGRNGPERQARDCALGHVRFWRDGFFFRHEPGRLTVESVGRKEKGERGTRSCCGFGLLQHLRGCEIRPFSSAGLLQSVDIGNGRLSLAWLHVQATRAASTEEG